MRTLRNHRRKIDTCIDSGPKILEIYKEQLKQEKKQENIMQKIRRWCGINKPTATELKISLLTNELKHRGII